VGVAATKEEVHLMNEQLEAGMSELSHVLGSRESRNYEAPEHYEALKALKDKQDMAESLTNSQHLRVSASGKKIPPINLRPYGLSQPIIQNGKVLPPFDRKPGHKVSETSRIERWSFSYDPSITCKALLDFGAYPYPHIEQLDRVITVEFIEQSANSNRTILELDFHPQLYHAYILRYLHAFHNGPPTTLHLAVSFVCAQLLTRDAGGFTLPKIPVEYEPISIYIEKEFTLPSRLTGHTAVTIIILWFLAVAACNGVLVYSLQKQITGLGLQDGHRDSDDPELGKKLEEDFAYNDGLSMHDTMYPADWNGEDRRYTTHSKAYPKDRSRSDRDPFLQPLRSDTNSNVY